MNEALRLYCDGAAMAYRDCADKIEQMIADAPTEVKQYVACWQPMADACKFKAEEVYKEAERFNSNMRN